MHLKLDKRFPLVKRLNRFGHKLPDEVSKLRFVLKGVCGSGGGIDCETHDLNSEFKNYL